METTSPTTIVIFGVTGDLSQRKLFPSLYELHTKGFLPSKYQIVGFSRRSLSTDEFRNFIKETLITKKMPASESDLSDFLNHLSYREGSFDNADSYKNLSDTLSKIDGGLGQCSNKLFYLAVPPDLYEGILGHLSFSGLTIPCGGDMGWTRVLIEKPFGRDVETAHKLDHHLSDLFEEEQIFRIDHYLAKETLQNILTFRFSNALFEHLWSGEHIESVSVKLFETLDILGRGTFYDSTGALRDVGQNHILQMLALVAMERPRNLTPESIRRERARVFEKLVPMAVKNIEEYAVRAQYEGYRGESNVNPESTTETYFKLKAFVNNERWRDVPFYLESGKALSEMRTEIVVIFKPCTTCLCPNGDGHEHRNKITFTIQPNEGISIEYFMKKPGFDSSVEPKDLSYVYRESVEEKALPDAYEKVLYDCIRGDQTLFPSTSEVDLTWKYVSPIIKHWESLPLLSYKKGSEGPKTSF
ncbi:MAG: glucose-6-phosphate dehydrogenase [Candidatus Pacebacteria bacterium]|nr:glucose-6-phosphate dehydrogenase [Candidatus Paceibacterota bacterium]MDD5357193.1 glucose-6-phosphate dehydrogenase [Candidatus Paceibacterota bacterium]